MVKTGLDTLKFNFVEVFKEWVILFLELHQIAVDVRPVFFFMLSDSCMCGRAKQGAHAANSTVSMARFHVANPFF